MRMEKKKGLMNKALRIGSVRIKFRSIPVILAAMLVVIFGVAGFAKERPEASTDKVVEGEAESTTLVRSANAAKAADAVLNKIASDAEKEKSVQSAKDRAAQLLATNADSGRATVVNKSNQPKSDETSEGTSDENASNSYEGAESTDSTFSGDSEESTENTDSTDSASSQEDYSDGYESESNPDVYIAADDDTLWDIAMRFGLDLDELISYNPDLDPDMIAGGYEIRLTPMETAYYSEEGSEKTYQETYEESSETYDEQSYDSGAEETAGNTTNEEPVEEETVQLAAANIEEDVKVAAESEEPAETSGESEGESVEAAQAESQSVEETQETEEVYEEEQTASVEESTGTSSTGQAIVDAALSQIGVTQTCTQLVSNSLRAAGIDFGGSPYDYTSLGEWTDNPQPGDICIYEGHVAIYIGDGQAVHGGWSGFGYYNNTQIFSVYVSTNTFLGYIHIPG